jgi:hypothetical protein
VAPKTYAWYRYRDFKVSDRFDSNKLLVKLGIAVMNVSGALVELTGTAMEKAPTHPLSVAISEHWSKGTKAGEKVLLFGKRLSLFAGLATAALDIYEAHLVFSLTRRPIRFHRGEKKIFAVRRRRFFFARELGDITVECQWNEDAFFCVHRGKQGTDHADSYHIRYYQLDSNGKVLGGFAIGREWDGLDGMNDLLCQWNYWCWYMSHGPAELPKPLLFLTERENLFESFLYCMYEVGFGLSASLRIAFMPFFIWLTFLRVSSLATCRAPIWPPAIKALCEVPADDPYQQPVGDMPVGWAATSQARKTQTYPSDPRSKTPNWRGEEDSFKNAELWRAEVAPGN